MRPSSILEYATFKFEFLIREDVPLGFFGILDIEESHRVHHPKCNDLKLNSALVGDPQHTSIGGCGQTFFLAKSRIGEQTEIANQMPASISIKYH